MFFFRVVAGLVVLFGFLTSLAAGADVTYSGVPGKWKKSPKVSKDKEAESAAAAPEAEKEKGTRTMIIPAPTVTVTPGSKPSKKQ